MDSLANNYTTTTYMNADLMLTDNRGTYNFSNVGASIYQEQTKDKLEITVDVANLESGVYFILMDTSERRLNAKLMIID